MVGGLPRNIFRRVFDHVTWYTFPGRPFFDHPLSILFSRFSKIQYEWVLLRIYDGELWFLKKQKVGNVGKRHVTKELTDEFIKPFYENSLKCDKFTSHLTIMPGGSMHKLYTDVYGSKKIDYPMEFFLAIVIFL